MNARQYLKADFAAMFPLDVEIVHDGQGVVMVMLPDMVVTIKSREGI